MAPPCEMVEISTPAIPGVAKIRDRNAAHSSFVKNATATGSVAIGRLCVTGAASFSFFQRNSIT